jgi:membrane protein implicated in regulation of membrane protease activity
MEISRKSWHYWIVTRYVYNWGVKNNLCGYFWQVVGYLLLSVLITVIALFVIFCMLVGFFESHESVYFKIAFIFWSIAIFFGFRKLYAMLAEKYVERKWNKSPKPKKPSILSEYIKAFIGKYCPKITFKD